MDEVFMGSLGDFTDFKFGNNEDDVAPSVTTNQRSVDNVAEFKTQNG
jgi:hypothetical protein